jgi:hypothetical protein
MNYVAHHLISRQDEVTIKGINDALLRLTVLANVGEPAKL